MGLEKKENISGKASSSTQEMPIGENHWEIERAKLVAAKVLQAEALHVAWEQEDAKYPLEGEELVWRQRLRERLRGRLWGGYGRGYGGGYGEVTGRLRGRLRERLRGRLWGGYGGGYGRGYGGGYGEVTGEVAGEVTGEFIGGEVTGEVTGRLRGRLRGRLLDGGQIVICHDCNKTGLISLIITTPATLPHPN